MSTCPVWVEISLTQLAENYRIVRNHIGPQTALLAVVKSDAYGHGICEVATALARLGIDWFGVTTAEEGVQLRRRGISQPILLLAGFWEGEQSALTDFALVPAVHSEEQLQALEAWGQHIGKRIRFHLKVDTGMGRLGIHWQKVGCFLTAYSRMAHVELEGLFTHFSAAEDFTTQQTERQEERFHCVEQTLARAGIHPLYCHQANSAAIVSRPTTWCNMVRSGLLLYGYQLPVLTTEGSAKPDCCSLPVREILAFKTKIIAVKHVPEGIALGYSGSYITPRPSRIAAIHAGYADGLDRRLSGRGKVIICGQYARIVGNISMNLTLVDVTKIPPVPVGEEVILIGRQGTSSVTALEMAEMAGTIPYEVLCGIGKGVPRHYLY